MGYYLDHAEFIQPASGAIAAWTWRPLPEPGLDTLPARGQEWELTRYREYQARLAGQPVGETFSRAPAFLRLSSETCVTHSYPPPQPPRPPPTAGTPGGPSPAL